MMMQAVKPCQCPFTLYMLRGEALPIGESHAMVWVHFDTNGPDAASLSVAPSHNITDMNAVHMTRDRFISEAKPRLLG